MGIKWTDRASAAVDYARREARERGKDKVECHDILLGLFIEGTGMAYQVLESCGMSLPVTRTWVDREVGRGQEVTREVEISGEVSALFGRAEGEARELNHNYVGGEHLLLAFTRETGEWPTRLVSELGMSMQKIRQDTLSLLGHGKEDRQPEDVVARADDGTVLESSTQSFGIITKEQERRLVDGVKEQVESLRCERAEVDFIIYMITDPSGDVWRMLDRIKKMRGAAAKAVSGEMTEEEAKQAMLAAMQS